MSLSTTFPDCMKLFTKQGRMLRKGFRTVLAILLRYFWNHAKLERMFARLHIPRIDENPMSMTKKMNVFTRLVFQELDCGPEDSIEADKITPHLIERLKVINCSIFYCNACIL